MTTSSRRNAQTWPYPQHRNFDEQLHEANARWLAECGLVTILLPFAPAQLQTGVQSLNIQQVTTFHELGNSLWLDKFVKRYNLTASSIDRASMKTMLDERREKGGT